MRQRDSRMVWLPSNTALTHVATFKVPIFGNIGKAGVGDVVELKAKQYPDVGKRVKIRYGPYDLPRWNDPKAKSWVTGEGGMIDKTVS
jgi:hypothetical protein